MEMQDVVERADVEDVFFDSLDLFSAEDNPNVHNKALRYEFWRNELRSVKERRDSFLSEMGFVESSPLSSIDDSNSVETGLEPMVETGESISSSCSSSRDQAKLVVDEPMRHDMGVTEYEDDTLLPSTSSGKSHNKRIGQWWKEMTRKRNGMSGRCKSKVENGKYMKVHLNKKRVKELSALFEAQEIKAHKGIIWSMKFSPDGQYLASGGQDGVVRVWRVKSVDSCPDRFPEEVITKRDGKVGFGRVKKVKVPVVIPDKMFQIEEHPLHEFHGHDGDVLDLAWSHSNYLLSSSMDKTVRLWHIGSDTCLSTFLHTDYVTCVQFNPVDDHYFISGSIDGKVRIWGVSTRRVLDWADVKDAVSALCYQPDGHGFVVGSLMGTCQFYETKGNLVELSAHIQIHSSKRSFTKRITGIQFFTEDSQKVMVMSEDSKLRIVDKSGLVCKYRGIPKSGGQTSASFSINRRHIVSMGEDSSVYMWNHDEPNISSSSSRHKKSNRSCERFTSEGVSVAASWSGTETKAVGSAVWSSEHDASSTAQAALGSSLSSLFSTKSSAIWPEDRLPIFNVPHEESKSPAAVSSAWGLVIVTASCDGMIKTFHNYGLPVKV
ncbi:WD repeat-containing protein YMR102C [Silene latifolia]|uniref:WD repeat-containing protein YMR102C n=1 Tax=Silene latifolia TaxID=37657 RepID=UPI003D777875